MTASTSELWELVREQHLTVDGDCWYSCSQAKHEDGSWATCDETRKGEPCDCGADKRNEALDTLRTQLEQELQELLRQLLVLREEGIKLRDVVSAARAWREQTEAEDNPSELLAALDALDQEALRSPRQWFLVVKGDERNLR
jgi:hypothetical protein